jgi:hypothetical protein
MLPLVAAEFVTDPVPKTEGEPEFPLAFVTDVGTAPAPTVTV